MAEPFEALVVKLLPSVEDCRQSAQALQAANPGLTPYELAERAVRNSRRLATVAGAGAGMVGNPLAMIPLASGELAIVLRQEAKMSGVVAALLDPDSLKDETTFQTDMLAIMFPGAISQALRGVGVQAGKATTKVMIRKYVSKNVLRAIIKFAAKYLGIKLTQRAIITKSVPLVGGLIGGAWNSVEVKAIGKRAILYHSLEAWMKT